MSSSFQCDPELFPFLSELPSGWRGKILSGGNVSSYEGAYGSIVLQEFSDRQFHIRYSVLRFLKKMAVFWKEESFLVFQAVLKGVVHYEAGNKKMTLKAGEGILVWAPHHTTTARFEKNKPYEIFQVQFPDHMVHELSPDFPEGSIFPLEKNKVGLGPRERFIQAILDTPYTHHARRFHFETQVRDLLFSLQTHPRDEEVTRLTREEEGRIRGVDNYILSNLTVHHTVPELAAMAHMGEGKFKWAFRLVTGMTPYERYKEARLQQAALLLLETDTQIKTIYREVGYDSIAAFSDAFKDRFGLRPSKYRLFYKPRP